MNTTSRNDGLEIDVMLEMEASPEEVAAVEEVLRREGIQGTVRASFMRLSMGELPWVIYLSGPLWVFVSAFLAAAGQDAWKGLTGFCRPSLCCQAK